MANLNSFECHTPRFRMGCALFKQLQNICSPQLNYFSNGAYLFIFPYKFHFIHFDSSHSGMGHFCLSSIFWMSNQADCAILSSHGSLTVYFNSFLSPSQFRFCFMLATIFSARDISPPFLDLSIYVSNIIPSFESLKSCAF